MNPEYHPRFTRTKEITDFLVSRRDQVATTEEIAEHIFCGLPETREALERLREVNRVDEIHGDMWHLE